MNFRGHILVCRLDVAYEAKIPHATPFVYHAACKTSRIERKDHKNTQSNVPSPFPVLFSLPPRCSSLLVDRGSEEALGVLDVDCLHVAVELLLRALLVVTFPGNPYAEPVGNALDTALPHLLVELRIDTDIDGTL